MKRVTGIGGIFFKTKDPEGNKIELWEPADKEFEKMSNDSNTNI